MKNGLLKYAISNIKHNHRRSINNFVCYSFFLIIAIVVSVLVNSFVISLGEHNDATYGTHNGYLCGATPDALSSLEKDNSITELGTAAIIGSTEDYVGSVSRTAIGKLDETACEQVSLSLVSGRLPENDNEIAVEEFVYLQMSQKLDETNTIKLTYIDMLGNSLTQEFILVGVLQNYTSYQSQTEDLFESSIEPQQMLPGIIIGGSIDEKLWTNVLISIDSTKNAETLFETYVSDYNLSGYWVNNGRLISGEAAVAKVFYTICILTLLMGIALLFFNFALSKPLISEQSKMLKCCGINNRILLKFRFLTTQLILIPASIIGIIIGIALSYLLVEFVLSPRISYINYHFSVKIVLIPFIAAVLFITLLTFLGEVKLFNKRPLEIKTKIKAKPKTIRFTRKFFHKKPILSWSLKSVYYYSDKYTSLILSLVVIFLVLFFVKSSVDSVVSIHEDKITYDYYIRVADNLYNGVLESCDMSSVGISQEHINSILESGEIDSIIAYSSYRVHILQNENELPPNFPFKILEPDQFVTQEMYNNERENYGYTEDDILYPTRLIACNSNVINELLSNAKLSYNDLQDNEVIFVTYGDSPYKVGDTVQLTQPLPIDENYNFKREDAEVKIAAIVNGDTSELAKQLYSSKSYFCISSSPFPLVQNPDHFQKMELTLKNKNTYDKTEYALEQLNLVYAKQQIKIKSKRADNEQIKENIEAVTSIGGIILVILLIYCFININSVFHRKLYGQKKTWGILRAGGLTEKNAISINLAEIFVIVILAWLFAIIMFTALFYSSSSGYEPFSDYFNLQYSLSLLPICLIVCGTIVSNMVHRFWKTSIITLTRQL